MGAARNANSEAAAAAVAFVCEEGGGGDESKGKRRASRSELPDGSWNRGNILQGVPSAHGPELV